MNYREQLHIDGMAIGHLVWDEIRQQARFETHLGTLAVLGAFFWSSISNAREFVTCYARRNGLGARGL